MHATNICTVAREHTCPHVKLQTLFFFNIQFVYNYITDHVDNNQ